MVGDVVEAPIPYTDMSGAKVRPVVILADVGMGDSIVCPITSSPQIREGYVSITGADMDEGGLRVASHARPDRLYSLNGRLFRRTLGRISAAKMDEITAITRALFPPSSGFPRSRE